MIPGLGLSGVESAQLTEVGTEWSVLYATAPAAAAASKQGHNSCSGSEVALRSGCREGS
jgi:hypothetical protein